MVKRTLSAFVSALVVLSIFLTACGSKDAPPAGPSATPSPAAAGKTATPAPSTGGTQGGVFKRLGADPPTLDPHLTGDTTSAMYVVEIFSGLVTITPDLKLEPDVAERWEVNKDNTVYTFFLRKNAKFHDGRQVTAQDVKYSLERATDPKLFSPFADTYLGEIMGARDRIQGKANELSGVKVIDNSTIQITTKQPTAYFLAMLTYPTAFIVDKNNIEQMSRNWTKQPNGTGPFKLKSYRIGDQLVLERNPNFYKEPAKLDQVVYLLRGGSPMAMYENNEIDLTGVGLADLDRVRDVKDPLHKDVVSVPPGFDISYIGFNASVAPFDDVKFRQALNYAVNKKLIADQVLANLVVPADSILPPGFPGYSGKIQPLAFNAQKAKQLLSESKYANNIPRIVLTVPGTGGGLGLDLEVIIEMWKQTLGVNVEMQQVEWATFLQDLNARKFQMFAGLGWQADYPDPHNFLDVLFNSQSELNHNGYANSEVDKLLVAARTEPDFNKRAVLYQQAEQMVINDAVWVPLWFSSEAVLLVKSNVHGFKVSPLIVPNLRAVWKD
ncbi:MAG: peptide ABC transporter substrate-binding protein [Dehalococcoidia bacterium]|nr:peptide ABC transporter substrate-binding protein [Dehalococcoidia bacterium]